MPSSLRSKKKKIKKNHCITAHLPHGPFKSRETLFGAVLYSLTEQAAAARGPAGAGAPQPALSEAPGPALQEFDEAQQPTRQVRRPRHSSSSRPFVLPAHTQPATRRG